MDTKCFASPTDFRHMAWVLPLLVVLGAGLSTSGEELPVERERRG